jgi:hypothetical protein
MTNTFVDGGGVLSDQPLPEDARVVFRVGPSGADAITVYVEGGQLVVSGQYRRLDPVMLEPNMLVINVRQFREG